MSKQSYAPAIQNSVLSALSTGPKTHRELHVIVSAEMVFNHGVEVTQQNVRSRTSELARQGLVRPAGRVKSRKDERRSVTLWARA
jgi:hypothetical protein